MPKVQPSSGGSGRGGRARRVSSTLAEINVVPLVDVMLVLLIIFMVTAPMIQQGIDVKLPQARRSAPIEGDRIHVTVPLEYRNNQMVYLENERMSSTVLQERIRQKIEGRADKQVFLRGDGGVSYQELMQVMGTLKTAGVENVGLVVLATEK
jgi:biopolymer transport protein TolR